MQAALTRREAEILAMAACGLTDKEIAARLGVARSTVSNHVSVILLKLGAANRAQAVAIAMRTVRWRASVLANVTVKITG